MPVCLAVPGGLRIVETAGPLASELTCCATEIVGHKSWHESFFVTTWVVCQNWCGRQLDPDRSEYVDVLLHHFRPAAVEARVCATAKLLTGISTR